MTASLHVETTGEGPDLVMLHGWGMHSGVWQTVAEALGKSFRLHCVDMPGHGRSRDSEDTTSLTKWTERVAETMRPRLAGPAYWCGWSLGGMVATQLAQDYPQLVKQLLLVAASLRFCQTEDWPDAVVPDVLQGFAANLQDEHRQTLQRFLALQVTGEPQARQTLRELKQRVFEQAEPETIALQSGLTILGTADLRPLAGKLDLPVLLIGGAKDRLVSPRALDKVAALLPDARVEVMPDCGHAPFISQPDNFVKLVKTFCNYVD
ncbi:MAG: pimeloyl-ACP methyl ester esterase BioH [Gammaproteobacteria bacterium]|nr:pimeloyl-ACP methyl ester esterase BioH [Gammaproteobacteria bacterium]